MDIPLLIGTGGMMLILLAFALNLFKWIMQDSVSYSILNIIGAGMLTYYALILDSFPFIILQVTWGLFALYKLILIIKK
jgi:hypothetical protein